VEQFQGLQDQVGRGLIDRAVIADRNHRHQEPAYFLVLEVGVQIPLQRLEELDQ